MTVSGLVRRIATRALGIATILLVNDEDDRKRPEADADEQRSVVHDELRRAASLVAPVHEVEIAEDAVKRKGNRQTEEIGVEFRRRFRADRVKGVRDQRGGG